MTMQTKVSAGGQIAIPGESWLGLLRSMCSTVLEACAKCTQFERIPTHVVAAALRSP
jgi:hypothetical protein